MTDQAIPAAKGVEAKARADAEAAAGKAKGSGKAESKGKGGSPRINMFMIVFLILMGAMEIRQNTVLTQSKVIQANSNAQNELNKEDGDIKFEVLPPNAGQATIDQIQQINQQRANAREDIQNSLITCRQEAQVEMTQTSTNVNILEQDASENSGLLKTVDTIFKVIDEMTKM